MAKLTDDVEAELQKRMEVWDTVAQGAAERLGRVLSMADSLWEKLSGMESLLNDGLVSSVHETAMSAEEGAQSAQALQQLLSILVRTVLESNSELAFAYEQSVELVRQRTSSEMDAVNTAMQGAFESALSLQRDLVSTTMATALYVCSALTKQEISQVQTADLASRQQALERVSFLSFPFSLCRTCPLTQVYTQGMSQLEGMTQTLLLDFDAHSRLLVQANNMTNDMLDTLEATAAATSTIQNSFRGYGELGVWWPYIVCPAVSLVMGSYGLPPSILRNIGLFTLGELAGAMISFHNHLGTMAGVLFTLAGMAHNTTGTVF